MGICLYISIIAFSGFLFSWLVPMLDNLSSIYPSILLIEGMKKVNEPPLYSALLQTLQSFENIQKENKSSEVPLYDEATTVIPAVGRDCLTLYLIRNEINNEMPAAPEATRVRKISRDVKDLLNDEGEWNEQWNFRFDGELYLLSRTSCGNQLAFIYKHKFAESVEQRVRYFPELNSSLFFDFALNGSNEVSSFSMCDNVFVYSRVDGFYSFHVLRLVMDGDKAFLQEVDKGEVVNRTALRVNEVTGVKLVKVNETLFIFQFKAIQTSSQSSPRVQLSIFSFNNKSTLLGNLYNISLADYVEMDENFDLLSLPMIRASNSDSIFVGHYKSFLMFIRYM
jgi:hypothetical protein